MAQIKLQAAHPSCDACMLYANCRTPFMSFHWLAESPPTSTTNRPIMIIGEAPGTREDWMGIPFVTRKDFAERNIQPGAGDLLWKELKRIGIKRSDCAVQNAVRCHPEDNKMPTKAVGHCRQFLLDDIELIKPRAILLLGAKACDSVLKKKVIGKSRMQKFSYTMKDGTDIPVTCAFHPAYVLRNQNQMQRFQGDLKFFKQVLDGKEKTSKPDALLYPTFEQLKEYLEYFKTCGRTVAFDFETNTLQPALGNYRVLCCGFSDGRKTIVIPLDINWLLRNCFLGASGGLYSRFGHRLIRGQLLKFVKKFLEDPMIKKCAQNAKYDMHVAKYGLDIDVQGVVSDTMLLHSFLYPIEGGHDLDNIASELLGTGKHKDLVKKYIGEGKHPEKWLTIPYHVLAEYCAQDAYVTACVEHKMQFRVASLDRIQQRQIDSGAKISRRMPSSVYGDIIMPGMHALYQVERHGILIDVKYNAELSTTLEDDISKLLYKIRSTPTVRKFENDRYKPVLAEEKKRMRDGKRKRQAGVMQRKFQETLFKPSSSQQMAELLYGDDYFDLTPNERQVSQATGSISTAAEWIDELVATTNSGIVKAFCKDVQEYKSLRTEKSTFVDRLLEFTDKDNRVHSSFHQGRARTGRLSSSDPNLQNVKRGSRVRTQFIAAPGHKLINLDYSQIELRVLAAFAQDKRMIEMFNSGHDIHEETARGILGVKGDVSEDQRVSAKGVNFGVIYGESAWGLAKQLGKSQDVCQDFISRWFAQFPEVAYWQARVKEFAIKYGKVFTMFGRSRTIENAKLKPKYGDKDAYKLQQEALRMAINTPVQGTASDFCVIALTFLVKEFASGRWTPHIPNVVSTVHDSIILEVPTNGCNSVARYAKGIMERTPLGFLKNQFDNIPIVVDVSIGDTWGSLKEVIL